MKNQIVLTTFILVILSSIFSLSVKAQVEIDKPLEMTGTYPDNNITGVGTIDVEVGYKFNGSVGTAGQLLRSNGSTGFVPATLSAGDIPAGSGHYIQNQTATNQSAGFRINGDGLFTGGNVGIGTANPGHRLHVTGGNIATDGGIIAAKTEDQITISHSDDITQERWKIRYSNSLEDWGLQFYDVSNDEVRMLIGRQSNFNGTVLEPFTGSVGIGTTSPDAKLDINGNLRVRDLNEGFLRSDATGHITSGSIDYSEIDNTPVLPDGSKWDESGNHLVNNNSGSVLFGGTTFPSPDNNSIIRVPARGTAGEHRNYIELQGVFANDATNEDGGAFIKFRTSTAANFGPEIGGIRRSGGSGDFLIKTGGSSVQERVRVLDNGNVGIGTPNPSQLLEVNGNFWLDGQLLGNVGRINMGASNLVISANQNNDLRLSADDQIRIESGESTWAAFTSNERFGLGTTSPDERLHVNGSTIVTGDLMLTNASGSSNTIRIAENHMISDHNGTLTMYGNRTTGASGEGSFKVRSHANFGSFRTDFMIDGNGKVGIGTVSPSHLIDIDGNARIRTTAGNDIIFDQSGIDPTVRPSTDAFGLSGTSTHSWWRVYSRGFVNTSDMRLKSDIRNSNYGLNEVMQMRPVSYKWRERPESGEQIGFIAQELLDLIPEAVAIPQNPDENYGVSYMDLIPVLVNAMQEQQYLIEEMKSDKSMTIQQLREQQVLINELRKDIEQLKSN